MSVYQERVDIIVDHLIANFMNPFQAAHNEQLVREGYGEVAAAILTDLELNFDVVQLEHSTKKLFVHLPIACGGRHCSVHNPSDHHMRLFKQIWRGEKQMMERECAHGVSHPDPDDIEYLRSLGTLKAWHTVHGCCEDICCVIREESDSE